MKLMVVDTALGLCTAGVFEVDSAGVRRLGLRSEPMVKGHSERIAGFARDAAVEAGVAFADLDRVGVTVGPGSFTGLRIGLATAKGLAFALDRPLWLASSLAALAWDAAAGSPTVDDEVLLVPALDARRAELYVGFYRRAGRGVVAIAPERAAVATLNPFT